MSTALNYDSILAQVMALPPDDRVELAENIIINTPDDAEIEAAQLAEVRRRIADDHAGVTQTVPLNEALRQVREAVLGTR